MLCKIADLLVEVPPVGNMPQRCTEYLHSTAEPAQITIPSDHFHPEAFPMLSEEDSLYLETGLHFYYYLMDHNGMMLHASAVEMDGKAYLFSAPCGTGKSTHARIWQKVFGEAAQVFNDDKPALRLIDGIWYAYGTPWCGKDGINQNKKLPLAGICFLKQAPENKIRRLNPQETVSRLLSQTLYQFRTARELDRMLTIADQLVRQVPIFELENRPEPEAARMSYEAMRLAAEEVRL